MESQEKAKTKPHWYKKTVYYCVLCGHEDVYRERMYTPRPEEYHQRIDVHETACPQHFF